MKKKKTGNVFFERLIIQQKQKKRLDLFKATSLGNDLFSLEIKRRGRDSTVKSSVRVIDFCRLSSDMPYPFTSAHFTTFVFFLVNTWVL